MIELPVIPDPTSSRGRSPAELSPVARLPEEWQAVLPGERSFRAMQVFRWIHRHGVFDPAEMSNLQLPLRESLKAAGLGPAAEVIHVDRSADGTRKLVLQMASGARVECVLIPMTQKQDADPDALADDEEEGEGAVWSERQRVTLCVSTQFGCAMGCVFCASGRAGLVRGLGAAEIVSQVLIARRYLEPEEDLRNLVFMGMGEPLHHYAETERALRLLNHPEGLAMSLRRVTVSTVGLVPGIRRLGEDFEGKVGLAVSLHAPDDETRDRIVPMNRRFPLRELMAALRAYPVPKRRRITIEYTLIDGVNDSEEHSDRLIALLRKLPVKINLIPMNPIDGTELSAPPEDRVRAFREALAGAGYSCFVRMRRGDDVAAACGQLAMRPELLASARGE